jgi:surfeit locus 1 family protein
MSVKFKFRIGPTLIAIGFFVGALLLANWQLNRAQQKIILQNTFSQMSAKPAIDPQQCLTADSCLYRKIHVYGEFLSQHTIYLDNKIYRGQAGYDVLTPLKFTDNGNDIYILVNRGWVAKTFNQQTLPNIPTVTRSLELEGIAVIPSTKFFQLSKINVEGRIWQNLKLDQYHELTGLTVLPVVLEQITKTDDGLIREWQQPNFGIEKHQGYAFQWFSLAALVLVLYFTLNIKRS